MHELTQKHPPYLAAHYGQAGVIGEGLCDEAKQWPIQDVEGCGGEEEKFIPERNLIPVHLQAISIILSIVSHFVIFII